MSLGENKLGSILTKIIAGLRSYLDIGTEDTVLMDSNTSPSMYL